MIASTSCSSISRSTSASSPMSPLTSVASGAIAQAKPVDEIVENDDPLAGIDQIPDHVAADIAGAAGDQYAHREPRKPLRCYVHHVTIGKGYLRHLSVRPSRSPSSARPLNNECSPPQGRLPRRRPWHPFLAGDQGDAEGDADRRRPAAHPVCGRRSARCRHRAFHPGHRPQQGGHRGSFRHSVRARSDAARARPHEASSRSSTATCRRPAQ